MNPFAGVLFPIETPRVTLPFADTNYKVYRNNPHKGVDLSPFPGSRGQPIRTSMTSKVIAVNNYGNSKGIGNELILETSLPASFYAQGLDENYLFVEKDEPFFLRYGHCDKILVQPGYLAKAGELLALIGNTGLSSGPHLHLEMRLGKYEDARVVNPLDMFTSWIVGLKDSLKFA